MVAPGPGKPTVPRCVVCAQPATKLKCVKCKTPYCSVDCQTVDWKERGHKKECKRLVEANAAAAAKGGAKRDEAQTPLPSPKPKAAPPVVNGPARGRADVAAARAAAAAATAAPAPAPEPEHWLGSPRCPVCLEDWDVNARAMIMPCCCKAVCTPCDNKLLSASLQCPLCRTPGHVRSAEENLAILRRSVENGIPAAIRQLGRSYVDGSFGLVPSHKKAGRLYQRAVDLGDVLAMYDLGVLYFQGQGVKLDQKKAFKYFRMAANRGLPKAQCNLGKSCYFGEGVPQDYAEAVRLYELAAEQGHTEAEYNLGCAYGSGEGVAHDATEAIRWYKRAAAKGYEPATGALARLRSRGYVI